MDFLHLDLECTGSNAQLGFNVSVSSFCRGEVLGGNALLKFLGLTRARIPRNVVFFAVTSVTLYNP